MRIVFLGASRFGLRCLDCVHGLPGIDVVGAVTAPRHFPISYRPEGVTNVLFADVEEYCREHAIPCAIIGGGMRDGVLLDQVAGWEPDAFLVVGWYHMVPKRWRERAPAYGMHASLLPDYSGGAPLVWAMINGERKTGITLFQLGDGVDDGPILGQRETAIEAEDTIATLYARIEDLGLELVREQLPRLADGTACLTPQDEGKRRLVPQRSPEDGLIDWRWPAARIHDFVRAQTRPYPGAFTWAASRKVSLWATRPHPGREGELAEAGAILAEGQRVFARCGDGGRLELIDLSIDDEEVPPESLAVALGQTSRFTDAP